MDLFLGIDVGGTGTRVAVVDADGRVLGSALGAGGNPITHPRSTAFGVLADTLGTAVAGLAAGSVRSVRAMVVGMAGSGSVPADVLASELATVAGTVGITCTPEVVGDAVTAFAAGTPEPDGVVVIAGTGAATVRMTGRAWTDGIDGDGWLLGDIGSAFWLGRKGVQAALAALDTRREATTLLPAVTAALLGAPTAKPGSPASGLWLRERIVEAVTAQAPIALARLAPLVSVAAAEGDPVAERIVAAAASALVSNVSAIRAPDERTPIVLAGSVAGGRTPVAALLRAELDAGWPGCVRVAGDCGLAAAWLAALAGGVRGAAATELHGSLFGRVAS
ncbi:N-acetylglucosamine kinase [Pseudonocardia sp. TRM90224]|uniref:N-acetylglucosamine kinase n=1 Tax=Pseudonocardia sp. TRM90224 TaxID=2812678 RepID=UPI001E54651B|nr:BadF/BadG/BcrA/BcrD ATPase family protein [Pseudonocardia sp. TRM90224]